MRPTTHTRRARTLAPALLLAVLGATSACGSTEEPSKSEPAPMGHASLGAAPSAPATPSGSPDGDGSFGDTGPVEVDDSAMDARIAAAQAVAERTAVSYLTWSYRDPSWRTWMKRVAVDGTPGFRHALTEVFESDSWDDLVVEPRLESRGTLTWTRVSAREAPTLRRIVFEVQVAHEIRSVESGDWRPQQPVTQRVVVVRDGAAWLVEDMTGPR